MRGLKSRRPTKSLRKKSVAPFTGAWIEISFKDCYFFSIVTSHPSRVRGLKYADRGRSGGRGWSHPLRGRGLKYPYYPARWVQCEVAPFTGAWIEITVPPICLMIVLGSHPSRGRGLKLRTCAVVVCEHGSRTLHGCVD